MLNLISAGVLSLILMFPVGRELQRVFKDSYIFHNKIRLLWMEVRSGKGDGACYALLSHQDDEEHYIRQKSVWMNRNEVKRLNYETLKKYLELDGQNWTRGQLTLQTSSPQCMIYLVWMESLGWN